MQQLTSDAPFWQWNKPACVVSVRWIHLQSSPQWRATMAERDGRIHSKLVKAKWFFDPSGGFYVFTDHTIRCLDHMGGLLVLISRWSLRLSVCAACAHRCVRNTSSVINLHLQFLTSPCKRLITKGWGGNTLSIFTRIPRWLKLKNA